MRPLRLQQKQLRVSAKNPDALLNEIQEICAGIEVGVQVVEKKEQRQNTAQKRERKASRQKNCIPLSQEPYYS